MELFWDDFSQDVLLTASHLDYPVTDFWRGGAAQPVFEIQIDSASMEITVERGTCRVEIESETGGRHCFGTNGKHITGWGFPETGNAEEAHQANAEMAVYFDDVTSILDELISAVRN